MKIQNQGFDHVEFVVQDIEKQGQLYHRMGFEKVGERVQTSKGLKSALWAQGFVRVLLTQPDGTAAGENQNSVKFLRKHAEGVTVLAIDVADATAAYRESVERGAKSAMEPVTFRSP